MVEVRRWEDLNTDCLIHIFERVGLASLILDIPYVCASWHKASLDPHCWKVLDFQPIPVRRRTSHTWPQNICKPFSSSLMKIAVKRSCGLTIKIVFHTCDLHNNILGYILKRCPLLKTLILPEKHIEKEIKNCLLKMICKLKNLESLMTLRCASYLKKLLQQIHIHCPNFVSLGFRDSINNDIASAIVTFCPNIKHLQLRGSCLDRQRLILILSGCRKLELLDVTNCKGFDVDDVEILTLASQIEIFKSKDSSGNAFGYMDDVLCSVSDRNQEKKNFDLDIRMLCLR